MARLSRSVFRLQSPLCNGLLVQIKMPSDLANWSMFIMKLVSNLQECIQSDHLQLNLRVFMGQRNDAALLAQHVEKAGAHCPSLKNKRISPHVLRHSTAMNLLQHGVDRSVIALWLGHESMETTQVYLHANLELKEQALAKTEPLKGHSGRYHPPDKLLAFLQSL